MESVTAVANIGSHTQGRRTAIYPRVRTIRRSANCTLVASAVHFATNTHRLALCARRTGNVFDKKTTLSLAFRIGGEKKRKYQKQTRLHRPCAKRRSVRVYALPSTVIQTFQASFPSPHDGPSGQRGTVNSILFFSFPRRRVQVRKFNGENICCILDVRLAASAERRVDVSRD